MWSRTSSATSSFETASRRAQPGEGGEAAGAWAISGWYPWLVRDAHFSLISLPMVEGPDPFLSARGVALCALLSWSSAPGRWLRGEAKNYPAAAGGVPHVLLQAHPPHRQPARPREAREAAAGQQPHHKGEGRGRRRPRCSSRGALAVGLRVPPPFPVAGQGGPLPPARETRRTQRRRSAAPMRRPGDAQPPSF